MGLWEKDGIRPSLAAGVWLWIAILLGLGATWVFAVWLSVEH